MQNSSIDTLLIGNCLLLLFRLGYACAINLYTEYMSKTTETNNANMRYSKLLASSPAVAKDHLLMGRGTKYKIRGNEKVAVF